MISLHYRTLHFLHDLDAFVGVRVVTNNIAKAGEMGAVALTRVGQHGFRCLEIGVKDLEIKLEIPLEQRIPDPVP